MLYFGLRTDSPVAELYLYDGTSQKASKSWQADRQLAHGLLSEVERFLQENGVTTDSLGGLFVYLGPGSFTGLRIGITYMNTVAYAGSLPIIGATNDDWRETSTARLEAGEDDKVVLPHYGADPRITSPKK